MVRKSKERIEQEQLWEKLKPLFQLSEEEMEKLKKDIYMFWGSDRMEWLEENYPKEEKE